MAQVLNDFDFKRGGRTGGHEKYPWGDWFDGQIWQLFPQTTVEVEHPEGGVTTETEGDFPGLADDFRTTCYSAATRRNVKIHTSAQPDGSLVIQKTADLPPKD